MIVTVVMPNGEVLQLDALDDMGVWTLGSACRKLAEVIEEKLVDLGYFDGGVRAA